MPTVGWIQETAEDRFNERGGELPRSPIVHSCPVCGDVFDAGVELSCHISEMHPLDRPVLLLHGGVAPRLSIVRARLDPSSVELVNTTHVRVLRNGRHVQSLRWEDVPQMMAEARRAIYTLELENRRADGTAKAEYDLEFAIAELEELDAVDELFRELLAVETPNAEAVRLFKEGAETQRTAVRYVDALINFAFGVIGKDGTGRGSESPDDVKHRFAVAAAELTDHQRPVACAIVAVCRLNLNDVRAHGSQTGDPNLDSCLEFLSRIATGGLWAELTGVRPSSQRYPLCPVDRGTYLVLRAFGELFSGGPAEDPVEEYIRAASAAGLLSLDRIKMNVLLAAWNVKAGRREQALPHIELLVHDPIFGGWAQSLDQVGTAA